MAIYLGRNVARRGKCSIIRLSRMVSESVSALLDSNGLELHPFDLAEYDKLVDSRFKTGKCGLAYLVISRPDFFEKCVVPHIQRSSEDMVRDPIDSSAKELITTTFGEFEVIFDYEMSINRLPKFLMQTGMGFAEF